MDFIAEFGFDVKKGQARDFQRWLSENGETRRRPTNHGLHRGVATPSAFRSGGGAGSPRHPRWELVNAACLELAVLDPQVAREPFDRQHRKPLRKRRPRGLLSRARLV